MLEIQSLSVNYGAREILREITFSVASGEIVSLIGPNGAGKSTVIRAVSGVTQTKSGVVTLQGARLESLSAAERARRVAVVPQARNFPPSFTAYQTVLLGRTPYLGWLGRAGIKDEEIVCASMRQTDTLDLGARLMGELSGGEQQRVLLARALAQTAPILLLDEPTNHLDMQHQFSFMRLVRQLAREKGLTVLMALHDVNLSALVSDRIGLILNGRLAALGTPASVLNAEVLTPAYGEHLHFVAHADFSVPLVLPAL